MIDFNRYITRFNHYAGANGENLVNKALTSATNVGEALTPEYLEQLITDTVIRLSPELALMNPVDSGGAKFADFNRITARPAPGGAMGESATTPVTQSATQRVQTPLKIVRRKGQVTDFLQDVSRKFIDASAYELQNHLQAHVLDLIHYLRYGNLDVKTTVNTVAEVTPEVEFDGWEQFASTNYANQVRGGIVPTSLKTLDDMVDANIRAGGNPHEKFFGMSPEMLSLTSRLETTVRKTEDIKGNAFGITEVRGGWRLATYRGIPIVETTALSPIETMRPGITLTDVGTGGISLTDDTYYINIAPVTYEGEQLASAEQSVIVNGGGSVQRIQIVLDAIHTSAAGVVNVFAYKIYLGTVSGTTTLIKMVPAYVYDANLAPIATATNFNGDATFPIFLDQATADVSVPTHMQSDVPLISTGGVAPETIELIDLDPIQGLGKLVYTNQAGSAFNGLVTTKPLAETDDFRQFLTKTYCALCDSFETTTVRSRGWRIA